MPHNFLKYLVQEMQRTPEANPLAPEVLKQYFLEHLLKNPEAVAEQVATLMTSTSRRMEDYKLHLNEQNRELEENAKMLQASNLRLEQEAESQRKSLRNLRVTADFLAQYTDGSGLTEADTLESLSERVAELIRQREQDRQLLEESQDRYSSLVEQMRQVVFQTDYEGRIIFLNSAWVHTTGYSVEESIGKDILGFLQPEDAAIAQQRYEQMKLSPGNADSIQVRFVHKDGQERYIEVRSRLQLTRDGHPNGVSGTFHDVTDSVMSARRLQELKDFYESILNGLPLGIAVMDPEQRYLFANPAAVADPEARQWILGQTPEAYCQKYGYDASLAEQRKFTFQRAVRTRAAVENEEVFLRSDNTPGHYLRNTTPFFDEQGVLKYMISYGLDLTERKHTENQLQSTASRLTTLIGNMNAGIVVEDEHRKIVLVNDHLCELFQVTEPAESLSGRESSELAVFSSASFRESGRFLIRIEEIVRQRQPVYNEVLEGADGRVYERDYIPIRGERQEFYGHLWQYRDITERVRMDLQLLEAKETAEESLRAKELFLANMSHEIRTPMNAILGMSNLLLKTEVTPKQNQYLEAIHNSSRNLLVIINDILDFSKIEAGRLELDKVGFRMKKLLLSTLDPFHYTAAEKSIGLNIDIQGLDEVVLLGDPVRFSQVVINLVTNAIKFTESGAVHVHVRKRSEDASRVTIECSVTDTGIGIPQDKLDTIFESFTQADVGVTRKFGGTGLGLSISQKLTEIMGGRIRVESRVNLGTTFTIEITFERGSSVDIEEEKPALIPAVELGTLRILLAEDHEYNRMYATSLLQEWGYEIDVAVNGVEAVQRLREAKYDLVLMDVQMPELDGLGATRVIRTELPESAANVPIIALTANAIKGDNERCLQAGMDDYVAKPFDPQQLHNKIVALVQKRRGISARPIETMQKPIPAASVDLSDTEPLVDLSFLRKMSRGNQVFVMNMINLFFETSQPLIEQVRLHHKNGEMEKVRKSLHKMKPSVDSMGMRSLKQLMSRIENAIDKQQHADKIDDWLYETYQLYTHCEEALRSEQARLEQEAVS